MRYVKHLFGNICEFDQSVENRDTYIEPMKQYFVVNKVTSAAKKKAILLSPCSTSTYSTIRCLAGPTNTADLEYSTLLVSTKTF